MFRYATDARGDSAKRMKGVADPYLRALPSGALCTQLHAGLRTRLSCVHCPFSHEHTGPKGVAEAFLFGTIACKVVRTKMEENKNKDASIVVNEKELDEIRGIVRSTRYLVTHNQMNSTDNFSQGKLEDSTG